MAEDFDFQSRTEAPTPRRREQAYERGQFAFSAELSTGMVLMFGIGGLAFFAHTVGRDLLDETRTSLTTLPGKELPIELVQSLFNNLFGRAIGIGGMLIGMLFAAALAVNLAQVGLRFNMERLTLDWERVSPTEVSRLLSWNKIVRGLVLLFKVIAVGTVAWWILKDRGGEITRLNAGGLGATLANSWAIILRLALGMAATLLVIGVADYGYQWWRFERSLFMTKQELKDEMKREEGDPQIKMRIRRIQRETAQRRMFAEVPKATVVVTNPTHLAVALRYEPGKMPAPKVVAKGAGHIAKRIVETARRHGVPVLERKSVARALFKAVKIDREVPLGLYFVVAELLAYVYRLRGGAPAKSA